MLVSIITPAYNSQNLISETAESIKAQTHENWEWLVTDDCSSDGTWAMLLEWAAQDSRIKPLRNDRNSGAAVTRNNSIARAKGAFIAFLDSDDLWLPQKLELHLQFMEETQATISFTAYSLVNEKGADLIRVVDANKSGDFSYQDMLKKKSNMGCCTVMLRKNAFPDISMPLIRAGQDYALWLKLLKTGEKAKLLDQPLSKYRLVKGSLSENKLKKALAMWRIYRDIENLGLIESGYVFLHYAMRALLRIN